MVQIRKAVAEDGDGLWAIMEPIIRAGDTYDFPRQTSRDDALRAWLAPANTCFVAQDGEQLVGTYVLHPNRKGGGAHVSNCGYMTAHDRYGQGIGNAMCAHSLIQARAAGYRAMQFNFVLASNKRAVELWKRMGFQIVGRIPDAFLLPEQRYTDAFVMYQRL
ncbi:GNAT family N-acetyltransferase [Variovorax ginsengisoli]|uniref:Ribosomal protein S18 acetylase RimI-like enzyme n=1 Tax=Variovorax ginsengisoli TaxID=363844 RepID=A0ABT9S5Q5_9BURK|nr:GNAT family N-acetyltransferase [Variovorax ginsengisoli]MDP9899695.1 ribosomal protein S18 acetylase RimI-like enzyme [Variovorax ginsengisoli]